MTIRRPQITSAPASQRQIRMPGHAPASARPASVITRPAARSGLAVDQPNHSVDYFL